MMPCMCVCYCFCDLVCQAMYCMCVCVCVCVCMKREGGYEVMYVCVLLFLWSGTPSKV